MINRTRYGIARSLRLIYKEPESLVSLNFTLIIIWVSLPRDRSTISEAVYPQEFQFNIKNTNATVK